MKCHHHDRFVTALPFLDARLKNRKLGVQHYVIVFIDEKANVGRAWTRNFLWVSNGMLLFLLTYLTILDS